MDEGKSVPRSSSLEKPHSETVRIGIHSGQQYADFASIERLWQRAEQLGFDWVSVFDHFRPPIYGPQGLCMEGLSVLSALAARTERIRCAMLVASPTWRHPALLAVAAATIDHVSGGRLELGLGAGGDDLAFRQYGIRQPSMRARFEQLEETCTILRGLWEGGPCNFDGEHYTLNDAFLNPRPVQQHIPLIIGGSSRRITSVVAKHADIWNCLASESYSASVKTLEAHCATHGRDPMSIRRSITFRSVVAPTAAEARRRYNRQLVENSSRSHDESEFISIGDAEDCMGQLVQYFNAGVRDFLIGIRSPVDWETIEAFAADVAPSLRQLSGAE